MNVYAGFVNVGKHVWCNERTAESSMETSDNVTVLLYCLFQAQHWLDVVWALPKPIWTESYLHAKELQGAP